MINNYQKLKYRMLALLSVGLVSACGGGGGGSDSDTSPPDGGPSRQWSISTQFVANGGPGKDGIPALENPAFGTVESATVEDSDLVLAVRSGDQVKVYPQDIMDWHEIVNEPEEPVPFALSYCPLTASAVAWELSGTAENPTFGVSGLLLNSNLLLYDRETDSYWSQALQLGVSGPLRNTTPRKLKVIETTFATVKSMYPDAVVMTRDTGHFRDYDDYPYGTYRADTRLLFNVERTDNRLHLKERGIGIHTRDRAKVYQLSGFGSATQTINDHFEGQPIVVAGNTDLEIAVMYSRSLADGSILQFDPIQGDLPNIMTDSEGNVWDVFGQAISGPRMGTQLSLVDSYSAMWFSWAAHFPTVELHF